MREDKFKKGINDIKQIKLSVEEKALIFSHLNYHIENNPIIIKPIKSPWYKSNGLFSFPSVGYSLSALVVVLLLGVGAISGAEKSLPGDTLYSLKVNVIEPLKYTVAVGDIAKANVETQNLTNRLMEVEALEVKGKLTESSQKDLEVRLQKHADSFNALVASSESSASSTERVIDTRINFEAKINAHSKILDRLESGKVVKAESDIEPDPTVATAESPAADSMTMMMFSDETKNEAKVEKKSNVSNLLKIVKGEALKAKKERETLQNNFIKSKQAKFNTATNTVNKLFNSNKKKTETIIRNTKKVINKKSAEKNEIKKEILDDTNEALISAESSLKDADKGQESGDREKALSNLLDSRRFAKEADASIEASLNLDEEKEN